MSVRRVPVNGEPGVVVWGPNGRPLAVIGCTVADGRIVRIVHVRDPDRLASLDLPGRPGIESSGTLPTSSD